MDFLNDKRTLLFAIDSYEYLQEILLKNYIDYEKGEIQYKNFPDGERYMRIMSDVQYRNVAIIAGTVTDADTLMLYDLACALVGYGASRLNIIIPFYGYATMERAVKKGEVVTAKTRVRLISAIPRAYMGNRVVLFDLHVAGLQHYFEEGLQSVHVYVKPIIIEAAKELGGEGFVLASTDAGRAKWVESLANDMGVDAAFVYKRRTSGSETSVTGVNADVKNKTVIIYDDMIRTGGSLIQAAQAYKNAGASDIYVISTHGVFPNNAVERIRNSGLINKIVVTDTHPNALKYQDGHFLVVKSISTLINQTLQQF